MASTGLTRHWLRLWRCVPDRRGIRRQERPSPGRQMPPATRRSS